MHIISKISLCTVIGVMSLSACKSKDQAIDLKSFDDQAYFGSLKTEVYKSKSSTQADIEALEALLPESLNLTYDKVSYSESSGATTLTDVNFTFADSDVGVNIETLLLWDVNEAALAERISGENLEGDFQLAGRIEARNLSAIGLDSIFAPMMDVSNNLNQKILEGVPNGNSSLSATLGKQSIDRYEFTLGGLIATDVKIHPWVLDLSDAPFGEEEDSAEAAEVWHFLQKMGAWNYAMSFADFAAYDSVYKMDITQGGEPTSFDMNIGLMGYKGYARGDFEYAVLRDMEYVMDMVVPLEDGGPTKSLKMKTSTDSYTYKDIELAQAMKHLAIGKIPERDNTDFMSLGVWHGQNTQVSIDDQNLYSLESLKLDMSEFHWLIPEVIDVKIDNAKYNVAGFMSWMDTLGGDLQLSKAQKAEMEEGLAEVTEVLKKHDMTEPSFDMQFGVRWDAETGASDMGYGLGIDDVGRFKLRSDGVLPTYDAVMNILPEDLKDMDEAAFEALFKDSLAYKGFSFEMRDEGFDKLYALLIDFAKMTPDNPQSAMLKNATPRQLRQMVAGGVTMGGGAMGGQFPPALQHVETVAEFFTDGGTLKIDFEAKTPLSAGDLDTLAPDIMTDPDKFEEMFTLNVVREAAE